MDDLPQRIKHWRLAAGLTLEQLAAAVGVTHGAVWQWEDGRNPPTVANLSKIAAACGVELRTFFGAKLDGRVAG